MFWLGYFPLVLFIDTVDCYTTRVNPAPRTLCALTMHYDCHSIIAIIASFKIVKMFLSSSIVCLQLITLEIVLCC